MSHPIGPLDDYPPIHLPYDQSTHGSPADDPRDRPASPQPSLKLPTDPRVAPHAPKQYNHSGPTRTTPCKSHGNGSNPNFQPPLEFRPTQNIAKKLHIPMTRTPPIPPKTPFLENRPTPPVAESYGSYHPR